MGLRRSVATRYRYWNRGADVRRYPVSRIAQGIAHLSTQVQQMPPAGAGKELLFTRKGYCFSSLDGGPKCVGSRSWLRQFSSVFTLSPPKRTRLSPVRDCPTGESQRPRSRHLPASWRPKPLTTFFS